MRREEGREGERKRKRMRKEKEKEKRTLLNDRRRKQRSKYGRFFVW